VKIYVAAVEALRRMERQDETQFTTKIDGFMSFIPRGMLMCFFLQFFLKSHPVYDQTQGFGAVFFLLYGWPYCLCEIVQNAKYIVPIIGGGIYAIT